jgi:hypothetical protein
MSDYTIKQTLMDVTIPSMSANETLTLDQTGFASGTNYMTTGGPTTTATGGAWVVEVTDIEVQAPRSSTGAYEDAREIWPIVDGVSLQHYMNFSGVGTSLMFPFHNRLLGGRRNAVSLGRPLWLLAQDAIGSFGSGATPRVIPNLPLKSTTLKYAVNFALGIHAVSAITGAGAPLRIIVKGYRYDASDLATFAPAIAPSMAITVQTKGRATRGLSPLQTTFVPGGPLAMDTFTSYMGGVGQKGVRVMPYWHHAYNAVATAANVPFVFSTNGSVGGASGNVEDPYQDLGFVGTNNQNALIVKGLGVVPVTAIGTPSYLARFGYQIDGTQYPQNFGGPGAGQYVSDTVNNHFFGDTGRYTGDFGTGTGLSGLYESVPLVTGEPVLIYRQTGVPYVVSQQGNGIPQDGVVVAISGITVEQS